MKKINPDHEISNYIKSISTHKIFMMDGYKEEIDYINHNRDRFISVIKQINNLIKNHKSGFTILDIGTSPLTFIIKKIFGSKVKVFTIDYSSKFKNLCAKYDIKFQKACLGVDKIVFKDKTFDIVTFCEVIEHIDEIEHVKVLAQIAEKIKRGGYCILQTPNKYSPKAVFTKLVGIKFWKSISRPPEVGSEFVHKKEYSLNELSSLIQTTKVFQIKSKIALMYYDTFGSAMVYRKFRFGFSIFVVINYYLTLKVPFLRRGMEFLLRKI